MHKTKPLPSLARMLLYYLARMTSPYTRSEELEKLLTDLDNREQRIFALAKDVNKEATYQFDFLVNTVLDRSLHLIFGFTTLIRHSNFICAAHLVRLHLDNLLRFFAAGLVDNPHEFTMEIMRGTRINQLKDRNGKLLTDSYLVSVISERHPWIKEVYRETSGFVHLSQKHIFTSSRLKSEKERTIEFAFSKTDNYVPEEARVEATLCMLEITDAVCILVKNWSDIKHSKV